MADTDKKPQEQTIVVESESQRASRALAQAALDAEEIKADEAKEHDLTVDKKPPMDANGVPMRGKYMVDDVMVDPMGRAFDQQPKAK